MGNHTSRKRALLKSLESEPFITVYVKIDGDWQGNVERVKRAGKACCTGRIVERKGPEHHELEVYFRNDSPFPEIIELMRSIPGVEKVSNVDAYISMAKD
ncbi:hypothetical protein BJ508DRAFT_412434 [Ascobolus immersus RN42]|uniref:Uncharacterized protein n=1 Tax=Ascobolus immersus RN42 TaxID=1160509 RepID=A0A3N4IKL1_ASCIM|nr:hypothetical protein BJ508DRAFT_412434 [Ascobolus immersus RN42]